MEFESLVRCSSPAMKALRGLLAAAVVLASTCLASPCFAQAAPSGTPATAATTAPAEGGVSTAALINIAIIVALFVVPTIVGSLMAKSMRMTDYAWKFAVAIGTMAAAVTLVVLGDIKLGPDLSGGITLIYEIERKQS